MKNWFFLGVLTTCSLGAFAGGDTLQLAGKMACTDSATSELQLKEDGTYHLTYRRFRDAHCSDLREIQLIDGKYDYDGTKASGKIFFYPSTYKWFTAPTEVEKEYFLELRKKNYGVLQIREGFKDSLQTGRRPTFPRSVNDFTSEFGVDEVAMRSTRLKPALTEESIQWRDYYDPRDNGFRREYDSYITWTLSIPKATVGETLLLTSPRHSQNYKITSIAR